MGVAAAKKLLLKLLLFFFPFLSHLFKLCPYVHDANGLTKFHHHHHQIAHLHHVPPYIQSHHHEPINHHSGDDHHQNYDIALEYYGGGPDLSADFLHRKKDPPRTVVGDKNEIHSWAQHGKNGNKKPQMNRPLTAAEIEALALKAEKEAVIKVRLQQEHNRVHAENKQLQEKIQQSLKVQEQLKHQMTHSQLYQKRHDVRQPTANIAVGTVQGIVPANHAAKHPSEPAPVQKQNPVTLTHDPFYSPILEKIDKILTKVGFVDEPCKERLICSMYKNPTKFSPHSNLVSAQLSRDSSELQKPTSTNAAVIRFYRYVQAARDGQDKRECLRLYPTCSINTEL